MYKQLQVRMNIIHICFSTDDGYAPYCAVAIKSIMTNAAENDKLFFYILHAGLSESAAKILSETGNSPKSKIELIKLDGEIFKDMPLVDGEHFSYAEAYFRLAIPRIFTDLEKVLYLDCDVLVRDSLLPLYSIDLKGKSVGMIKDNAYELGIIKKSNFNSGVMLINCEKWRCTNIEWELLQYARENRDSIRFVDQDVINGVLRDDILALEDKYNKQIRLENLSDVEIDGIIHDQDVLVLHYVTSAKPWHGVYQNKLTDEYYAYMEKSGIEYQDLRGRNKNIDRKKYYEYQACLRYLLYKKIINKNIDLFLVFKEKIEPEFAFAADDLDFQNVQSVLENEVDDKTSKQRFMIFADYDYSRITKKMCLHGYMYEQDYVLLRTTEHEWLAKELTRHRVGQDTRAVVYGTAGWGRKCTEVLERTDVQILFYLDSDKAKAGSELYGKRIVHPDELVCREGMCYDKIVIASSAYRAIKSLLLSLGINEENIICFEAFM